MLVDSYYQRTPAVTDAETPVCVPRDAGDVRGAVVHPQPSAADFPAADPWIAGWVWHRPGKFTHSGHRGNPLDFLCQMPSVRAIQTILIICVLDLTFEGSFKCVKLPSRRWRVQQAPFTLARRQVRADLKQRMIFLKLYWQAYIPRIKGLCFDLRTGSVARTHLLEHNSYWSDRNKDVRKFVRKKRAFWLILDVEFCMILWSLSSYCRF